VWAPNRIGPARRPELHLLGSHAVRAERPLSVRAADRVLFRLASRGVSIPRVVCLRTKRPPVPISSISLEDRFQRDSPPDRSPPMMKKEDALTCDRTTGILLD
jgi:hypothetical protein